MKAITAIILLVILAALIFFAISWVVNKYWSSHKKKVADIQPWRIKVFHGDPTNVFVYQGDWHKQGDHTEQDHVYIGSCRSDDDTALLELESKAQETITIYNQQIKRLKRLNG